MSVQTNKATLESGAHSFNDPADRSGWLGIHAAEVVAHGLAPEPLDQDGLAAFYETLWNAFPDMHITIGDMVGEGDRVAWRLTVKGTQRGSFRGIPPSGTEVVFGAQYIFRFREGEIVERWTNFDRLGVLAQLGAVAVPA